MPALNVNILLHGLFFMTQEGGNVRIYAPNIPNHHFAGGIRGARLELSGEQILTNFGLRGKADPQTGLPAPDPNGDVDGSIMQFSTSDVGGFNDLNAPDPVSHQPLFKGSILLPWPIRFIALRAGTISGFRTQPGSIASRIVSNARTKNRSTLGVVALLQYTLPAVNQAGGISQLNVHYYLQPCSTHFIKDVNADLKAAKSSFKNSNGFDLQMLDDQEPPAIPPSGHLEFGTTQEDELAFEEERRLLETPDVAFICRNDPFSVPAVSPANCPIFFVGP